MKRIELPVKVRERIGKGGARSARREGLLPGIVYGRGIDPLPVSVDRHTLEVSMKSSESENILVNLKFEDEDRETLTLIRDTQHHVLNGNLEHVDFLRISVDQAITTSIPVHAVGTPQGVKDGGVFDMVRRDIEIECLPLDIPDYIEIDVSALGIGDSLHVSDLPENPKINILTDPDESVATVTQQQTFTTTTEEDDEGLEGEAAEGEAAEGEKSEGD